MYFYLYAYAYFYSDSHFHLHCHLYNNHMEQVQTQLARQPFAYPLLRIKRQPASIFDYQLEDFEVEDYLHHPAIKAPVSV